MDDKLINDLQKIKADFGFINFVLENACLKDARIKGPLLEIDKKRKAATWKKIKRRLKRIYGEDWRDKWEMLKQLFKEMEKEKEVVGKYGSYPLEEPITEKDRKVLEAAFKEMSVEKNREDVLYKIRKKILYRKKPKKKFLFNAVFILQAYFIHLTTKPKWNLIARIVSPYCNRPIQYNELRSWWAIRGKDYEMMNDEYCMLAEHNFYNINIKPFAEE